MNSFHISQKHTAESFLDKMKAGKLKYGEDFMKTDDSTGRFFFDGGTAFKLMDSHGLPLEILIDTIHDKGGIIMWDAFADAAWEHDWYSYQIYEKVMYGFSESISHDKAYIEEIRRRLQIYICQNDEDYKHLLKVA